MIIYEILKEKDEVFQTIDFEEGNIAKRFALYIKKLKNLSLEIVIDKMFFKKFEITAEEDEVSEENTEKYIEYSVKEFLETGDLDDYFIKYFKEDRGKYIVFIFEREFIEGLVEFALENRLKIEKIKIKDEKEYILNDYDVLLNGRKDLKIDKKTVIFILILFFLFLSIRIYNFKIEKEIENLNQKILLKEEEVNKIKTEHDTLEKEIAVLNEKIKESSQEKEYFSEKILRIFENIPENITVENIYFEKNILNIKGISDEEKYIFDFLEFLEKDEKIEKVKYDYIVKRENFYEFFLEARMY
ncbi:hypothetical protein HUW86_07600 [Fusobacterium sp. SB021]|uniref:PilN domain-containing protein n=1 Tax=Fusobacterium sp. SB021 TaxID=2744227 RepID=UPI003CF22F74